MIWFTLLLTFSLCLAQNCTFYGYGTAHGLVDHRSFVDCLLGVNFNQVAASKTIDTLSKSATLYAFLDAVKNSPKEGLAHFQIDILDNLKRINKTRYDSDADFQQDLSDLFIRLRDPHTTYVKSPECYAAFALQPLSFGSSLDANGNQIIFVSGYLGKIASDPLYKNIPFSDLLGAEVTFIDEQPALEELMEYAKLYGYISKDDGSAFNWAVHSGYQQRPMVLFPPPLGPSQHIEFAYSNGTFGSFHIPWGFFMQQNVTYSASGCRVFGEQNHNLMKEQKPKSVLEEFKLPKNIRTEVRFNKPKPHHQSRITAAPDHSISIHNVSSDVIVLQITSFVPASNKQFLAVVDEVVQLGLQGNIPNLILDVRGNGGGDICLGYQVIHNLIAEPNPIGHYDIIHSPLMDLMVSRADDDTPLVGPSWWTQADGTPYPNSSWYTPGLQHVRGGVTGTYSNPSYHNCDFSPKAPAYLFKKILILSDGLCGSTCAVFTSHLDEVDHIDTVTVGGIWGNAQQAFSFPGGQVMDYANIVQLAQYLRIQNSPLAPAKFPNKASFRFTWLEIYPWLPSDPTNTPLEFIFFPSTYRLPVWPADNDADLDLYLLASKFLDQ